MFPAVVFGQMGYRDSTLGGRKTGVQVKVRTERKVGELLLQILEGKRKSIPD